MLLRKQMSDPSTLNDTTKTKLGGSALTPILFMTGTVATFTTGLYIKGVGWPAHVGLVFTGGLLLFFLRVYWHLLQNDPNRLHSEHHIQRMRSMDLMGDNLIGPAISTTFTATGNPALESIDEHR